MAQERLVDTSSLKTKRIAKYIEEGQLPFMRYDEFSDNLMLVFGPTNVETVVHYIEKNMALLYRPDTLEVVGFQVEAFRKCFMEKYSTLEKAWRLTDTGVQVQLNNVGDMMITLEERKRTFARELKSITDHILGGGGKWNMSEHLVLA
ncbi:MAG: hypothetical protein IT327_28595 [Anaerolineae bacterium]|nr:hypothetical protein [Anaerolineae bacterium]